MRKVQANYKPNIDDLISIQQADRTPLSNEECEEMIDKYSRVVYRLVAQEAEVPEVYIRRSALYMAAREYQLARKDAFRAIELRLGA